MDKQNEVCPYTGILFGIERNEVFIHATIRIKTLKTFILSERSQSQMITYDRILHNFISIKCSEKANSQKQRVVAKRWSGWGKMGNDSAFGGDKHVLNLLHNSVNILKASELYTSNKLIIWHVDYISIKLLLLLLFF